MKRWIIIIAAIAFLALHEKLSATKYWFLGGLLPLAGIGVLVYELFIVKAAFPIEHIIAYLVFFVGTILLWLVGRRKYKEKELNKMKAKDI